MILLNYKFKNLQYHLDKFWDAYYQPNNTSHDNSPIEGKVSILRQSYQYTYKIHQHYRQFCYSQNSWFKSFILFTQEYGLRKRLSEHIDTSLLLLSCLNRQAIKSDALESKLIKKDHVNGKTKNSLFFKSKTDSFKEEEHYFAFRGNKYIPIRPKLQI